MRVSDISVQMTKYYASVFVHSSLQLLFTGSKF